MPTEAFIGEIYIFAGDFAPPGTALCNGQSLSIAQNPALFSLLGTYFGGNGTTNFLLPDLRGRAPVGQGTGAGLSNVVHGEKSGSESVTLTVNNIPSHAHGTTTNTLKVTNQSGDNRSPAGNYLAATAASVKPYAASSDGSTLAASGVTVTLQNSSGGSNAVDIRSPYIAMNYIIYTTGIYPSRD